MASLQLVYVPACCKVEKWKETKVVAEGNVSILAAAVPGVGFRQESAASHDIAWAPCRH